MNLKKKRSAGATAILAASMSVSWWCGAAAAQPGGPGSFQAQQPGQQPGRITPLRPVEQGVGDLNPLQVSNRLEPTDLHQPTGWDRVYRLSGDPARDGGRGLFARFDGGIAAVFPWSAYHVTPRGVKAEVPAGTTYYIGELPASLTGGTSLRPGPGSVPGEPDRSYNFLDLSARAGAPERPRLDAGLSMKTSARDAVRRGEWVEPAAAGPSIWTSESYRRDRLEALLGAASR